MSDTNQVALRFAKETLEGDIPTAPAFNALRYTGLPSFGLVPQTLESQEIRGTQRDVADLILVGFEVGAEATAELLWGAHDDLWSAAMFARLQGTSFRANSLGAQITDITTNVITMTDETASQGPAFRPESIVELDGFAAAANAGVFPASAGSATSLTLAGLTDAGSPVTAARIDEIGSQETITAISTISGGEVTITSTGIGTVIRDAVLKSALAFPVNPIGLWLRIGSLTDGAERFSGGDAGYNDVVRVKEVTDADNIIVNRLPSTFPAGAFAGSQSCWILWGQTMVNGNLRSSFSLEAAYLDHVTSGGATNPTFGYSVGALLSTWELNLAPQAIAQLSAAWFASQGDWSESGGTSPFLTIGGVPVVYGGVGDNRVPGATTVPAVQTTPLNTSSNVARISENGSVIQSLGQNAVLEATMSFNNNLRRRNAIGVAGAAGIGSGSFQVTGNLGTYFDTPDLVRALVRNLETALDFALRDQDLNVLIVDMPRVKYSAGSPTVGGVNQDTNLPLQYQAILDADLNYTVRYQSITALA